MPSIASAQLDRQVNDVVGLLNAGGTAMLEQGVQTGFQSLPAEYRSLGLQTARLVGLTSDAAPSGPALSFPQLAMRLDAVTATATQLVDASKLDLAAALRHEPQQRIAMLAPHVNQLKEAGRVTAAAVAQMPVAELRFTSAAVKDQLTTWANVTENVHEQLKAQFGEKHPTTVAALEARTEASAAFCKTIVRMAVANLGSKAFNMTVGPIVGGLARMFGAGN